jgi:hypothetical protein
MKFWWVLVDGVYLGYDLFSELRLCLLTGTTMNNLVTFFPYVMI